jgi:hypothetical protein
MNWLTAEECTEDLHMDFTGQSTGFNDLLFEILVRSQIKVQKGFVILREFHIQITVKQVERLEFPEPWREYGKEGMGIENERNYHAETSKFS